MTFDPALTTPKDQVRQRIGDTEVVGAQVQDETIAAYLGTMSVLGAARQLCLDLAAKWARVGTVTLDDQQQRGEAISKHYLDLAAQLAKEDAKTSPGVSNTGSIFVGGLDDCRGPIDGQAYSYGAFVVGNHTSGP